MIESGGLRRGKKAHVPRSYSITTPDTKKHDREPKKAHNKQRKIRFLVGSHTANSKCTILDVGEAKHRRGNYSAFLSSQSSRQNYVNKSIRAIEKLNSRNSSKVERKKMPTHAHKMKNIRRTSDVHFQCVDVVPDHQFIYN